MSQEGNSFYFTDPEALAREMARRRNPINASVEDNKSFALCQSAISLLRIANALDKIEHILASKSEN